MSTAAVGEDLQIVPYRPTYQNLRAGPSIQISLARFVNSNLFRHVDVLWINFQGVAVRYAVLEKNGWVDVNTFVGHSWLFRDSRNGLPLICLPQKSHIFLPETPSDNRRLTRKVIKITIPVYSLKSRCLEIIANHFQNSGDAEFLPDLPASLKNDLISLTSEFESYRTQRTIMPIHERNTNQPPNI